MRRRFGLTAAEELTCGCHVHVAVDSEDEGVGALDRIRPWLAPLLALTANSPFWQGLDSGYASYRSQVWSRWPSAGPYAPFGSSAGYHGAVGAMLDSDTVLDRGMVYYDARLSAEHPTVEIRVGDVCLDVDDAVLLAALARGAGRDGRAGVAGRHAGRSGAAGAAAAGRVARRTLGRRRCAARPLHVASGAGARGAGSARQARRTGAGGGGRPAAVQELLSGVFHRGTGARAQRAAGDPRAAVSLAVRRTRA